MFNTVIMADYGRNTGIGHLMRCGALAKEMRSSSNVVFCCRDEFLPFVSELASKNGCEAVSEESAGSFPEGNIAIIDSYGATEKYLTDLKKHYDVCVVIDDNCPLAFYDADLIINHNIGAERHTYKTRKDTELLLGTEYAILRDSFANKPPIDIEAEVKDIVISMGGADLKNATEEILRLVVKHTEYTFHVVIGPGFASAEGIESCAKEAGNVELCRDADIPGLFARCQGAVSACGSTIYELAVLGVPTIGVVTADNQQNASIAMENSGIIASAGLCEKLSNRYFDALFEDVIKNREYRKEMHHKQLKLIPRDGARKIKEKIIARYGA